LECLGLLLAGKLNSVFLEPGGQGFASAGKEGYGVQTDCFSVAGLSSSHDEPEKTTAAKRFVEGN